VILKKYLKKLADPDFLNYVLISIVWILAILSFISIVSVFFQLGIHFDFALPDKNGIKNFISQFEDFKILYSATIAIIVAYIALKNYSYNKRKDFLIETYKAIDFYLTTTNSNLQGIIERIKEKEIGKNRIFDYTDFTVEALVKEDYNKMLELFNDASFRQSVNIVVSTLDIVSYKFLNDYIDKNVVISSIGKDLVSCVNTLYPVISISRTKTTDIPPYMIHYDNILSSYNEINKVIMVASKR
jgi:hypothetical protein